jgi:hypothetical protein
MSGGNRREERRLDLDEDRAFERFMRFHQLMYQGKPDSEHEVEAWMERMEDIFTTLRYTDQRRVQFGAFSLEGLARDWWQRKREMYEDNKKEWTWEDFLS